MKLRGKVAFIPSGIQWRIDCDYLHKLSPKEREYMEQFLYDYYLSNRMTSPGGSPRGDIVTAPSDKVGQSCAPAPDGNLRKRGSYMPSDYSQPDESPEDAVVSAIDTEKRNALS